MSTLLTSNIALDLWRARREGTPGLERRRQRRLDALVAHARTASPFYRHLYRGLQTSAVTLDDLPPVAKPQLMEAFDDWVTDSRVTRADVEGFVSDPARVGAPYRDGAFVCTSSGTTGHPGLWVHDRAATRVYDAQILVRGYLPWLGRAERAALAKNGARAAAIAGTGGHFAGAGWYERSRRRSPWTARSLHVFPVQQPVNQLVAALNEARPTVLTGYPSALEMLAAEQEAGRLRIQPVLAGTSGESLAPAARARITAAFGCRVAEGYAASETMFTAFGCDHGWLHVSSDWAILEPVDRDHRPTPPGQPSHTVLVTNLANRLQPLIRYDIGDAVLAKPDPCLCGNPLPAVRVAGRSADAMRLVTATGREVTVLPLAIGLAIDRTPHVRRAQLVQTGPTTIRVRLEPDPAVAAEDVWRTLLAGLRDFLASQHLDDVDLVRADEPPELSGRGGKFRRVVVATPRPSDRAGSSHGGPAPA